jgi:hypothetical protein
MSQETSVSQVLLDKDNSRNLRTNLPAKEIMQRTQQSLNHNITTSADTANSSLSYLSCLREERAASQEPSVERRRRVKCGSFIHSCNAIAYNRKRVNSLSATRRNCTSDELTSKLVPCPTLSLPLRSRVARCPLQRRHRSAPRSWQFKSEKKRNVCLHRSPAQTDRGTPTPHHELESDEEIVRLSRALDLSSLNHLDSPINVLASASSSPGAVLTDSAPVFDDASSQATFYSTHIQPILLHAEALLQTLDIEELQVPTRSRQQPQQHSQLSLQVSSTQAQQASQRQEGQQSLSPQMIVPPRCDTPDPIAMLCGEILKDNGPASTTMETMNSTLLSTDLMRFRAVVPHSENSKSSAPPLRTPSKSLPRFITSKDANRLRLVHSPRPTPMRSRSMSRLLPTHTLNSATSATVTSPAASSPVSISEVVAPRNTLNFTSSPRSAFTSPRRVSSCTSSASQPLTETPSTSPQDTKASTQQ